MTPKTLHQFFRITPEARDAMAASSLLQGIEFEDTSTGDASGLLMILLSSEVTTAVHQRVPWLDMDDPIAFSEWIVDCVYSSGYFNEEAGN